LAINAGSSSLKLGLFSDDTCERLVTGEIDWAGGDRQQAQLVLRPRKGASMCSWLAVPDDATAAVCAIQAAANSTLSVANGAPPITAVGHRIVHGGEGFRASVLIDQRVKVAIGRLCSTVQYTFPGISRPVCPFESECEKFKTTNKIRHFKHFF
jgi:acetate kinase